MKKILTFFLLCLLTIACSSSNEDEVKFDGDVAPSGSSQIVLSIVNTNGDKLLTNGKVNRYDVSVEYKKNDVFVPMEFDYCNPDQSDIVLFDQVLGFRGITNYKLTFPNQQVYYIDVEIDFVPTTSDRNFTYFVKKVYVNNEMIYEGNESASGNKCHGHLMLDLIINE